MPRNLRLAMEERCLTTFSGDGPIPGEAPITTFPTLEIYLRNLNRSNQVRIKNTIEAEFAGQISANSFCLRLLGTFKLFLQIRQS